MRLLTLTLLAAVVTGCAPMPDAMPTSPYQWERRQERIVREEADRKARCEAARTDEARARWCREGETAQ